ncbi:MAG: hypothetical protein RL264_1094 [Bacteroidota bacterium]|jgi:DNA mismatch repair protein MutS2
MAATDFQTLTDLEFETLRQQLITLSIGETAKSRFEKLQPINDFGALENALQTLNDFHQIRLRSEVFPALDFEELKEEIKWLGIDGSVISIEGFRRLQQASDLMNRLLRFIEKRTEVYPNLFQIFTDVYETDAILLAIEKVFDRAGNVRDDASPQLSDIRQRIKSLRQQINRNFEREMRKMLRDKVLGETNETFLNDRRVLTVQSTFKRKVPGNIHGSSKTGSLTFIEPLVNVPLNNELEFLLDDERKEIHRILKILTKEIAIYLPLIIEYQRILTELDYVNAKSKMAMEMKGVLPGINRNTALELIEAYHPILEKSNRIAGKKTIPQYIKLDNQQRMLVISGPNAGGKSITLKTVGLLQLMLQSGLLVPVNPNSKMCFFQQIFSDIGDNQSIENELSTYSYRLRRMKFFLKNANRRTLLLLDEFGTGSDPELGGALAEVFFEELYHKQAFSVITTHYGNIKLKADELKQASNGCMLFDAATLQPLYRLQMGQPGSSFTFEVARINGIKETIIEAAQQRLSDNKVRLDKLLNALQKEKNHLDNLISEHIKAQQLADEARTYFLEQRRKLEEKLKSRNEVQEKQNKQLSAGKKMLQFIDKFNVRSRKKDANSILMEEIRTFIKLEKSKLEIKKSEQQINKDTVSKGKTQQTKPLIKKATGRVEVDENQQDKIVKGSQVQLLSSRKNGTVEQVQNDSITVLFDNMRMKVEREKLRFLK